MNRRSRSCNWAAWLPLDLHSKAARRRLLRTATRAAASDGATAGGECGVGSRDSHHHRPSPASSVRFRPQSGPVRREKRSSTTSGTAARACRCRGAPARWPRTWRCAHTERRAAVMGSGVVGLTSARELQRRGFDVTIYAATVPPDTTSNMSLAGFTPTSGLVEPAQSHAGMGRAVSRGGADRLSPAPAARRSEVRHQLDHELRADG